MVRWRLRLKPRCAVMVAVMTILETKSGKNAIVSWRPIVYEPFETIRLDGYPTRQPNGFCDTALLVDAVVPGGCARALTVDRTGPIFLCRLRPATIALSSREFRPLDRTLPISPCYEPSMDEDRFVGTVIPDALEEDSPA